MKAIELAQYLEAGRPTELELLGYLSDAAAELRRLAAVEAELTALRGSFKIDPLYECCPMSTGLGVVMK